MEAQGAAMTVRIIPEPGTLEWEAMVMLFNADLGPALDIPPNHPSRFLSKAEMRRKLAWVESLPDGKYSPPTFVRVSADSP